MRHRSDCPTLGTDTPCRLTGMGCMAVFNFLNQWPLLWLLTMSGKSVNQCFVGIHSNKLNRNGRLLRVALILIVITILPQPHLNGPWPRVCQHLQIPLKPWLSKYNILFSSIFLVDKEMVVKSMATTDNRSITATPEERYWTTIYTFEWPLSLIHVEG